MFWKFEKRFNFVVVVNSWLMTKSNENFQDSEDYKFIIGAKI